MNPPAISDDARMVANRLRKNLKRLSGWRKQQGIHCYRLYDADIPEYAVAVDIYQTWPDGERLVHLQEYAPPKTVDPFKARRRLDDMLAAVREVLQVTDQQLFLKVRQRQKGSEQYNKLGASGQFHTVQEHGHRLLVNLSDYLDTGLFLDHRSTRALLQGQASGQHFLNLFAYTGSASVYAAAGGAASTTTVDLSNTYLDWAGRNMQLNGYQGQNHRIIRADCMEWLRQTAGHQRFGLIFLDPPSYSSSKRMRSTFDVQRDHVPLLQATLRLLEPGGTLIFSNNRRHFRMDRDALAGIRIEDISARTLPRDYQRNPRIHNCWRLQPGP